MRQELTSQAEDILSHGISITLTDDRKVSVGPWKEFQSRLMTHEELHQRSQNAHGLAIITGKVSGGLEVIDIDLKYDNTGKLYEQLQDRLKKSFKKFTIAKTVNNGYHLYYRCHKIEGNQKLAMRWTTDEERQKNPLEKELVLIETRGEAGYVVAPPSNGYEWIQGDYKSLPTISEEEREHILEVCRSFNTCLKEVTYQVPTASHSLSPLDDYNERADVIELLQKHGWTKLNTHAGKTFLRRPGKDEGTSGDYLIEKRWFSVFTTSTQFEPNKAYNPAAVFCKLEANDNWTDCVKLLAKAGYGKDKASHASERSHIKFILKQISKGMDDEMIIHSLKEERKIPITQAVDLIKLAHKAIAKGDDFWTENAKGKIIVNKELMIKFLEKQGFRLLPLDTKGNELMLVQIIDNIIEESSYEKIKKILYAYAKERNEEAAEWLLDHHALFNESYLEFLQVEDKEILRDTETECYFPFLNCIVRITAELGFESLEYGQVDKLIWKSAIRERYVDVKSMLQTPDGQHDEVHIWDVINPQTDFFAQFLKLICDNDINRFNAAITTVGYLLHGYKNPSRPWAICLAEEVDDDAKGGGTGKGIFIQAIAEMVKVESFNGKNWNHTKNFQLQRVTEATRVLAIQDLRKAVDFEGFYNMITEPMHIERKNQNEIEIPFAKSPKIAFTTNYMIPELSNHARRRLRVFPFSDYFSPDHTPLDEFGIMLFSGWDSGHWNNFYNFMFHCVHYYLTFGLIAIEKSRGMKLKTISNTSTTEFRQWFEQWLQTDTAIGGHWVSKNTLYLDFIEYSDYNQKEYSAKRFATSLKNACTILGLEIQDKNFGTAGGRMISIKPSITDSQQIEGENNTSEKKMCLTKNEESDSNSQEIIVNNTLTHF